MISSNSDSMKFFWCFVVNLIRMYEIFLICDRLNAIAAIFKQFRCVGGLCNAIVLQCLFATLPNCGTHQKARNS